MKRFKRIARLAWVLPVAALLGCPAFTRTIRQVNPGQEVVEMEAGSFYFTPNVLEVPQTGPLTLRVENVSDIEHNISIDDPDGTEIHSQDIQPGQTIEVTVNLDRPGTYNFRCDIGVHSTLGMRGSIEVAAAP